MIVTIEIKNDETEHAYFLTLKDRLLTLGNSDEEGMVLTEAQLYYVVDDYFQKEL